MKENRFYAGMIFESEYPPEAADWCDTNDAYIEELSPVNGVRQFQIVAIPEPTPEEIEAQLQKHYTDFIQSMLDKEAQKLRL